MSSREVYINGSEPDQQNAELKRERDWDDAENDRVEPTQENPVKQQTRKASETQTHLREMCKKSEYKENSIIHRGVN